MLAVVVKEPRRGRASDRRALDARRVDPAPCRCTRTTAWRSSRPTTTASKKYQWTIIPLELRGVVCVCENGEVKARTVRVATSRPTRSPLSPTCCRTCYRKQMTRKATEVIKGEGLNILIGSVQRAKPDESTLRRIKLAIMEHLNREYSMTEAVSCLPSCAVPAFSACDIGFDRSFVSAYGSTTAFAPTRGNLSRST